MSTIRLRTFGALGAGLLLAAGAAALTGCGGSFVNEAADTPALPISVSAHIEGKVHGGAFPIQAAHIELWQTGVGTWDTSTGSYTPSFFGTTANTNYIAGTTSAYTGDGTGRQPGYFDFGSQTLTCTPGNYLYLTTTGGETVSKASHENDSVIQVAVIGTCEDLSDVQVYLSELSTVAAAYTLGNFISIDKDPTTNLQRVNITAPANNTATSSCSGTGTAMTCTAAGLANGFANALNLVDSLNVNNVLPSGAAFATLPKNSNAIAPQAMVNTLGNILQSCVDSGPSTSAAPSSVCSTLFGDTATGYNPTSSPGVPTNTLQAAINIARNPTYHVTALYGLQTPNGPFNTPMSVAPANFVLSILYPASAVGDSTFSKPVDVALDSKDNVFVAYTRTTGLGAVAGLSASGTSLFSGAQPTSGTIANPGTLSVDPSGRVWLADSTTSLVASGTVGNVIGFTSAGTYYNTYTVPYGGASGIAFDTSGNLFVGRDATDAHPSAYLFKSGTYTHTQAGTKTATPMLRAAIDSYGTFYAVGGSTFLTWAPVPSSYTSGRNTYACASAGLYAESSIGLSTTGGMALAIDNRTTSYNAFLPMKDKLSTGNVTIANGQPANCWTATTTENNPAGSATTTSATPNAAALDGLGNLFWSATNGLIYTLATAEADETTSGGTLAGSTASMSPCFLLSGSTSCTYPTSLAGMAVDSSGAMWYVSSPSLATPPPATPGPSYLVQSFGLATPTWPLLSYEKAGVAF